MMVGAMGYLETAWHYLWPALVIGAGVGFGTLTWRWIAHTVSAALLKGTHYDQVGKMADAYMYMAMVTAAAAFVAFVTYQVAAHARACVDLVWTAHQVDSRGSFQCDEGGQLSTLQTDGGTYLICQCPR